MLTHPATRYRPVPPVDLPDRHWPSRVTVAPPIWCAVDLRDGNQALATPMSPEQKKRFLKLLRRIGLKEIEVGFPAASRDDFDFVRAAVAIQAEDPEWTLQVLTQARKEIIERTFEALKGARRAIVHLYNSTSPVQRRVVFGMDQAGIIALARQGAEWVKACAARQPETEWIFEYSPESFSATEPEFALAICAAVCQVWQPTPQHKVILNLPATVEVASPNHYADQIEWFHRHFPMREAVILSVHPHNDRGCAVAAAELAMLAGAERVEGTLFGNGERTGNVDLITLALNLYTQGIATGLDFSSMDEIVACYEQTTDQTVPIRHPYAGERIFTAFSGSHQDAIRKGLAVWRAQGGWWEVPYLPLDPAEIGRGYEGVIRVNGQSGKAGVAELAQRRLGFPLPRRLQGEFAQVVQGVAEGNRGEMLADQVAELFEQTYLRPAGTLAYVTHRCDQTGDDPDRPARMRLTLKDGHQPIEYTGEGNGPIDACLQAFPQPWRLWHYEEHALDPGSAAAAVALIELESPQGIRAFGMGRHSDIVTAAILAVIAAMNRATFA
ncbi:MAG: 2-isopropylmalate synthase [Magnetococcales bacterium]|nr:2-isopropylmalate synthase [Magnetococcales bacterium]